MSQIEIKKIVEAVNASDGAGVKLKRSIGTPKIDYVDPFLMLDEFGSDNKEDYVAGFPPHPHRGIETVTYMLHGKFEHEDSTGSKGEMEPGDVQWMKTGRGIIHSEMPAMSGGKLLGFQLWINMPAKLKKNKPEYVYIKSNELGTFNDNEKSIKIIAGQFKNIKGPQTEHNVEPIYFHIVLNKEKEFNFDVPLSHNSFIYLLKGELKIGTKEHIKTKNSNLILLEKGNKLLIRANEKSEFLFIAGKPIGEPIARGGPFVMNTKAEILEAIKDYNNGTFAKY
ncbi:MAG: pirin family protein [Candidatus Pelagibacter sp. TMED165]|nr:MAG: pirin family protein [Candidatus Pelagibacter sp. TMED165]|tara:strand:+ start:653 stop:1495 length:843 start_codon:yes stop_codon:yes gene_type:complete